MSENKDIKKLLKHIVSIENTNAELRNKVSELETELYFCNRNRWVEEIVDERTKMETPKIKM